MSVLAQQVVNPTVRDPDNVPEKFANGPVNVNLTGAFATLTFTNVRPDLTQAFKGEVKDFSAIVVTRLTMPTESLVQLRELLNRTIQQPTSIGSFLKQ